MGFNEIDIIFRFNEPTNAILKFMIYIVKLLNSLSPISPVFQFFDFCQEKMKVI